jgi:hypothetical protein
MNRQNAQYELKIIMTKKSLFSFAFLFMKNTFMPKIMEIVLANKDKIAYRFIYESSSNRRMHLAVIKATRETLDKKICAKIFCITFLQFISILLLCSFYEKRYSLETQAIHI